MKVCSRRWLRSSLVVAVFALAVGLVDRGAARAQAPLPPPASFQLNGNALVVEAPVVFATADAAVDARASAAALDHVAAYLKEKSFISTLRVEVHVDNAGDAAAAQRLTQARALAVVQALVARGVDCQRLLPVGFGSTKPIAANDTPEGRAQNRRVTFVNAALRGRAIGGFPVDGGGVVAGDACAPAPSAPSTPSTR